MNKTEAERLAILETEFKHVSQGMDELKRANAELIESMAAMVKTIDAWDNKFRGGKTALAAMLSVASVLGGAVTWFMTHIPHWTIPLPK